MEAEFKSWEYPPTERAAMLKSSNFCIVSMVFGATQCRFIISYRTKDNKIVRLWIHSHDKYSDVIETQNGEYSLYASGDKLEIYKLPIERFIPIVSVDNWGKISVKGNFSWERL